MSLTAEVLTHSPLLDVDDIEGEIGNLIYSARRGSASLQPHRDAEPSADRTMPDYVAATRQESS